MSGFLPSCRLQRRLPDADRLLLSAEFQDLRKTYSRDQLLTALEVDEELPPESDLTERVPARGDDGLT